MAGLNKGDEVVTAGGIVGTVNKVEDDFIKVQVANNVELRIQKSAVGATLPKGTIKSLDES
jgi:preprotein translocase subunit YajC